MHIQGFHKSMAMTGAICFCLGLLLGEAQTPTETAPPEAAEIAADVAAAPKVKASPQMVPNVVTQQGQAVVIAPPVPVKDAEAQAIPEQDGSGNAPPQVPTVEDTSTVTVIEAGNLGVAVIDDPQVVTLAPPPPTPRSGVTQADVDAAIAACEDAYAADQTRVQTEFATPRFATAEARAKKRKASLLQNLDNPALVEGFQGPVKRRLIAEKFQRLRETENRRINAIYDECMANVRVPENEYGGCPTGSYLRDEPDENGAPVCLMYRTTAAPIVINRPRLNDPAEVLRVAFKGGSPTMRHAIMKIAKDWENKTRVPGQVSGGLRFDFGTELPWGFVFREWSEDDQNYAAEIRISFDPELGYWSLIGNDSYEPTVVYPNEASMNLGGMDGYSPLPKDWRKVVYHEFGHAIGLEHEHQHPNSDCGAAILLEDEPGYELTLVNGRPVPDAEGRRPSAVTLLGHAPNFWEPEEAILNLQQLQRSDNYITSDFDGASIMRYEFPAEWYATDAPSECLPTGESAAFPSPVDIAFVRRAYANTVLVSTNNGSGTVLASPED